MAQTSKVAFDGNEFILRAGENGTRRADSEPEAQARVWVDDRKPSLALRAQKSAIPTRAEYTLNRNQWTLEQLAPYRGQWIAWNLDGKSIVAYHEDMAEVCRITQVLGYDGGDVLLSFLPAEEEIWY